MEPDLAPAMSGRIAATDGIRKGTLQTFLEKLARRRRRLQCSRACHDGLQRALLQADSHKGGHPGDAPVYVTHNQLREFLRHHPKSVSAQVLRELVDAALAYDREGDGRIDVHELLDGALDVEPGPLERGRYVFPVLSLVLWVLLAPAIFCVFEQWSAIDAFYFAAMTLLTVGQELVPSREDIKYVTLCYVFLGYCMLSWCAATFVAWLLLKCESFSKDAQDTRDSANLLAADGYGPRCLGRDGRGATTGAAATTEAPLPQPLALDDLAAPLSYAAASGALLAYAPRLGGDGPKGQDNGGKEDAPLMPTDEHGAGTAGAKRSAVIRAATCLPFAVLMLLIGSLVVWLWDMNNTSYVDALYWSVLTCTTVGGTGRLGITTLSEPGGRAFVALFSLVAVPSGWLAVLAIIELVVRARELQAEALSSKRRLPADLLADLDCTGLGVGKLEFLCATLLAKDKVSAHDLWEALDDFRHLDTAAVGVLSAADLGRLRQSGAAAPAPPPFRVVMREGPPLAQPMNVEAVMDASSVLASKPCSLLYASAGEILGDQTAELSQTAMSQTAMSPTAQMSLIVLSPVKEMATDLPSQTEHPLLAREIYQDTVLLRKSFDEKDAELRRTEVALRQVYAERQALHGELLLLKHQMAEVQSNAERQVAKAETQAEAAALTAAAERERAAAAQEQRHAEAAREKERLQRCAEEAATKAAELSRRLGEAEARVEVARREIEERDAQHAAAEKQLLLQQDAKVKEVRLMCAEIDTRRRCELRTAMMEMQALSHGQQALRTQLRRSQTPPPSFTFQSVHPKVTVGSGQQPWEVWERASANLSFQAASQPREALLSGKVQEQAELLETQLRHLQSRGSLTAEQIAGGLSSPLYASA